MVFLDAIAGGVVTTLDDGWMQGVLVVTTAITTLAVTAVIVFMIAFIVVKRNPALLFNPRDIDPSAHSGIYDPGETPTLIATHVSLYKY